MLSSIDWQTVNRVLAYIAGSSIIISIFAVICIAVLVPLYICEMAKLMEGIDDVGTNNKPSANFASKS